MRRRAVQLGALALGVIASALLAGSYPAVPLSMTCAEFASLDEREQLRILAWMDGYARQRVRPAAQRELDRVVRGCRQSPAAPVRVRIGRVF